MHKKFLILIGLLLIVGGCSSRVGGAPNLEVSNQSDLPEGAPALTAVSEGFYLLYFEKGGYSYVPALHRSENGKDWEKSDFPSPSAPFVVDLDNILIPRRYRHRRITGETEPLLPRRGVQGFRPAGYVRDRRADEAG